MSWYYATKEKTQAGPVDEAGLQALLSSGEITPETLIWQQGMTGWTPYSAVFNRAGGSATPPGTIRCAECGQPFPPEQLINLAGRSVCATCKPVAMQKFQEGVVSFGRTEDPEQLWQMVQQRGYDFTIGSVLSRAWELVKGNFWPTLGVTVLGSLIFMGASQIPFLGIVAAFLVQPQIIAGLYWYFLRQFRGEEATLNNIFDGFRRGYGQQALYMLFASLLMFLCMLPFLIPMIVSGAMAEKTPSTGGAIAMIVGFIVTFAAIYFFTISWIFTPLLILDKGLKAMEAMKLSFRVTQLRFWKLVGFFLVMGLLACAGVVACCVGIFVVMPVMYAAIARLYEDIFAEERA